MDKWLARAERHDEEWELPLQATSYPSEVGMFWRKQTMARQRTARRDMARTLREAKVLIGDVKNSAKEYGQWLDVATLSATNDSVKALCALLNDPTRPPAKLKKGMADLRATAAPLLALAKGAHKAPYKEAHDLLLTVEDSSDELHVPDSAKDAEMKLKDVLSKLRKLLVAKAANPRLLERGIAEVKAAREAVLRAGDDGKVENDVEGTAGEEGSVGETTSEEPSLVEDEEEHVGDDVNALGHESPETQGHDANDEVEDEDESFIKALVAPTVVEPESNGSNICEALGEVDAEEGMDDARVGLVPKTDPI